MESTERFNISSEEREKSSKKIRRSTRTSSVLSSLSVSSTSFSTEFHAIIVFILCFLSLLYASSSSASASSSPYPQQSQLEYLHPPHWGIGGNITRILDAFFNSGYDKRVRPNYGGPPVDVGVTMYIISISSVSEVQMDFTSDFYFRQAWKDSRLSFKNRPGISELYVGAEVADRIWVPDTFFANEKSAYFHTATTPNTFLRIGHSGEVFRSMRLTVTANCPMELQYFPMDRQLCTIEVESYGYSMADITYRWAKGEGSVGIQQNLELPQFRLLGHRQKTKQVSLSTGNYSRLICEIQFARSMGYYLIQIYIPASLIVIISWVSFWLHRNATPARVALGVTTVLTMTTLMSSTNAALPKISYIKSIDVYLGTCFVMVFASLLEYATVGYLGKRIAMRRARSQQLTRMAEIHRQRCTAAAAAASIVAQQLQQHQQQQYQQQQQAPTAPTGADTSSHMRERSVERLITSPILMQTSSTADHPVPSPRRPPLPAIVHQQQQQQQQQTNSATSRSSVTTTTTSTVTNPLLLNAGSETIIAAPPPAFASSTPPDDDHQEKPTKLNKSSSSNKISRERSTPGHLHHHTTRHTQHHQRQLQPHQLQDPFPAYHENAPGPHGPVVMRPASQPHQPQHHQHSAGYSIPHAHHPRAPPQYPSAPVYPISAPQPVHVHFPPVLDEMMLGMNPASSMHSYQSGTNHLTANQDHISFAPSTEFESSVGGMGTSGGGGSPFNNPNKMLGVSPSDIDKYSRVVFPVCFVCFNLMYWVIYMHISDVLVEDLVPPGGS